MSWAVLVTRQAGFSKFMPRVQFPTESRYLKHLGQVQQFDSKEQAEHIANLYTKTHKEDEYAICAKTYKAVHFEIERHGTG